MSENKNYSLMIHGGAGALDHISSDREAVRYLESLRQILEHGRALFEAGEQALGVVEICTSLLEDDPLYNAGCGSVLNEYGKVEMDAAVMDGRDISAGAVAGVSNIANPIQLARLVMAKSEHVMLVARGANRFGELNGVDFMPDTYFVTDERRKQFDEVHALGKVILDHDEASQDQKFGTVGCVALDPEGNLAAATSTGGIVNKQFGRVGDSPIIGAGVYADNETCAVSATGYGEDFMRTVLAKRISDSIDLLRIDAPEAVGLAMEYLTRKVAGRGGVIVIDRNGNCASAFTTKKMIRAWIERGGEAQVTFS